MSLEKNVEELERRARGRHVDDALPVHLCPVTHPAQQPVGDARGAARARGDLSYAVGVRLDPEQIRRVIINLVDNAIEAMERQGEILLETQIDIAHSIVRVIVADNGPGIPAGERDKLFLPYYSTKRRGSGLGLAIVRRIIAEHGGNIDVGDNVPRGTRFTIELPC